MKTSILIILLCTITSITCLASSKLKVGSLVCEYRINPVGIDVLKPRLSWKLVSSECNLKQHAYEIKCASSEGGLAHKDQLIWHTKKVKSDQSVSIPYKGKELQSLQRIYWQVRLWDNKGNVSE